MKIRRTLVMLLLSFCLVFSLACTGKKTAVLDTFHPLNDEMLPIVGIGPNNDEPSTIADLHELLAGLNRSYFAKKTPVIAICMHDLQNDWSRAIVRGITETLAVYGLQPAIVTDGEFNLEKQLLDFSNVIALKPDVMIVLPLDVDAVAGALREAVDAGIKLAFIDAVPSGFTAKKDYVAWAVGDAYVMGKGSAELLCESLGDAGTVALLHWKKKMFTVDKRSEAARVVFAGRKGITVVDELYFDDFSEVGALVGGLLDKHPNLGGLWAVWDTPAFEAIAVIKARKAPTVVAASDMSIDVARAIARSDVMIGTTVDHPFDQGVIEGLIAVAALAGIDIPPYFVVPAEKVRADNLGAAWRRMYHTELPTIDTAPPTK